MLTDNALRLSGLLSVKTATLSTSSYITGWGPMGYLLALVHRVRGFDGQGPVGAGFKSATYNPMA